MSKAKKEKTQKPIELDHITAREIYSALVAGYESDLIFLSSLIEDRGINKQTAKIIYTELYNAKKSMELIWRIENIFAAALETDFGKSLVLHKQAIFNAYVGHLQEAEKRSAEIYEKMLKAEGVQF